MISLPSTPSASGGIAVDSFSCLLPLISLRDHAFAISFSNDASNSADGGFIMLITSPIRSPIAGSSLATWNILPSKGSITRLIKGRLPSVPGTLKSDAVASPHGSAWKRACAAKNFRGTSTSLMPFFSRHSPSISADNAPDVIPCP